MRLTDEELKDVLARAEEIQRASTRGEDQRMEIEAVIGAAEEMGLTRPAVEQALRERFDFAMTPPTPGTRVFARSADGKFYVAEVISNSSDGTRVRFLRGSEHVVGLGQIRPCAFLPGEKIICDWPLWGPWECTVISYDATKERVKVHDGWRYTRYFAISDIWVTPKPDSTTNARMRVYAKLIGTGMAVGAILGAAAMALLR